LVKQQNGGDGPHAGETAHYPIRVVARRTGLSSHVIRVWERRYAAVTPERSPNGYRQYTEADIDRLRGLHELTEAGYGIGDIAGLDDDAMRELLDQKRAVTGPPPEHPDASGGPSELTVPVARSMVRGAVAAWDAARLTAVLREAAVRLPLEVFLEDVLVDLMRQLGHEWKHGDLSPAREHMVSSAVPAILAWVADRMPAPAADAPLAVFATPSGARHDLGARLAELVARSAGWRTLFLGGDLPAVDIVTAARDNEAAAVAVSVVYPESDPGIRAQLEELVAGLEGVSRLLIGGAGAASYSGALVGPHVERFTDLDAVRERFAAA
jgi:DNA-binding transcriptional MerR regulator/methylmalonyl-CoA mutase cobalamin-binding subunit